MSHLILCELNWTADLGCWLTYLHTQAVRTRLPFHALRVRDHDWRIITAELNADTVHQWIAMSRLLQLPTDSVYTTAVRNIVRCHVVQLSSHTAQWSEHSVDTTFMDTVHSLLSQVTVTQMIPTPQPFKYFLQGILA